jgi:hypothetical protein
VKCEGHLHTFGNGYLTRFNRAQDMKILIAMSRKIFMPIEFPGKGSKIAQASSSVE